MSDEKTLTLKVAKRFLKDPDSVSLDEYTAIDDEAARLLGAGPRSDAEPMGLYLCGLTSLSDAAAAGLAEYPGELSLDRLPGLSIAAAMCFSKHKGELTLDGLTSLSDAVAESLGHHEGSLSLGGLTGLSNAAAASLAKHRGILRLDGLTSLSDSVAESLAQQRPLTLELVKQLLADSEPGGVNSVELESFTTVDDDAAVALSAHKGHLCLDGVTSISAGALRSLSVHEGFVSMTRLANITADHANALVSFRSGIDVPLEDVNPDIRCILARHPSLRIDSSRVDSWLSDELGYDFEGDCDRDWISDDVYGGLLSACDGWESNDPNGEGTLGSRLDDVMSLVKKAGHREIHVVYLCDKSETTLVFIGSLEEVKGKLLPIVSVLHKKNPADNDTTDEDDDDSGDDDFDFEEDE